MGSYLPDKVFVVCSNQLGNGYKQLTIDSDLRPVSNQTVQLGSQSRVFLVKLDKKLTADFTCKSGCSSGAGTMAFGAGVAIGMAATVGAGVAAGLSVAAAAAVIPVAGWIVGGIIAVGCLVWGAYQIMKSPTCSQMIGYEESKWVLHHETVRFDSQNVSIKEKHLALVKNSMLVCKEPGGILLPFISESLAAQAADAISDNNKIEMGLGIAAGAISGFMLGISLGAAAAPGAGVLGISNSTLNVLKEVAIYGGWMIAGHFIINPAADKFGDATGDWLGNETYDRIKDNAYQDPEWWEDARENAKTINPNDEYNLPEDLIDVIDLRKIRDLMKQNKANEELIAIIDGALKRAEAKGKTAIIPIKLLKKIRKGEFGKDVKDIYAKRKGKRSRNTKVSAEKAIEAKRANTKANTRISLIKGAKAAGAAIQILQPFVGAFFAERAVRLGAEIFDQDAANSIKVNAIDY